MIGAMFSAKENGRGASPIAAIDIKDHIYFGYSEKQITPFIRDWS
jgi:hypothetical protein